MKELVRAVAEKAGVPQTQAQELVQTVLDGITDLLVKQGELRLGHFGVFELRQRRARTARNPRTGEQVHVPPRIVASFRPGVDLKQRVGELKDLPRQE